MIICIISRRNPVPFAKKKSFIPTRSKTDGRPLTHCYERVNALDTSPRTLNSHATRFTRRVTSIRTTWFAVCKTLCRYAKIRASSGVGSLRSGLIMRSWVCGTPTTSQETICLYLDGRRWRIWLRDTWIQYVSGKHECHMRGILSSGRRKAAEEARRWTLEDGTVFVGTP